MRLVNWVLGLLMFFVVGAVVITAYNTETHGDGKVEVYMVVQQRNDPFGGAHITYAFGEEPSKFAVLSKEKAQFHTEKRRIVPGKLTEVFIRYEPGENTNLANEYRCRVYVNGDAVKSSEWATRRGVSIQVCSHFV